MTRDTYQRCPEKSQFAEDGGFELPPAKIHPHASFDIRQRLGAFRDTRARLANQVYSPRFFLSAHGSAHGRDPPGRHSALVLDQTRAFMSFETRAVSAFGTPVRVL